jgi:hypothetical protein
MIFDDNNDDEQIQSCLRAAGRAAANWEKDGMQDAAVTLIVATPRRAMLFSANQWPAGVDGVYDRAEMMTELIGMIERQNADAKKVCLTVRLLIDDDTCRDYGKEAASARERGEVPLFVYCVVDATKFYARAFAVPKRVTH